MRVDQLVAALRRDDRAPAGSGPLLAALGRDTPAFGGTTTVAPRARPAWPVQTRLLALVHRFAPPTPRQRQTQVTADVSQPASTAWPLVTRATRAPAADANLSTPGEWRGDGAPRQAKREPWPPPLFAMPEAAQTRRLPSTTTRRLCAAVHLDDELARRVVEELTDDPRRAVAPSVGFDVEPVLCHALRARLLGTARDAVLTVAVLAALLLAPRTAVAVLLAGAVVGACRSAAVRTAPPQGRALLAVAMVFGIVTATGAVLTVLGATAPGDGGELDRIAAITVAGPGWQVWAAVAVLAVAAVAGHLAHLWWTAAALAGDTHPAPLRAATAGRVAVVAAAQRGNVAFSRAAPFVGAGPRVRGWSVAVALQATDSGGYRPRSPAALDPLLLRRHVGQALQGLGDGTAHQGSGVPGLTVTPYLAADGVRCAGDPMLDGDGTPLPMASREVVEAVIRGPQEGLRHYDRVVILPRARGVATAEGRPVVPPDDGDGHVSVFVHTSIEASVVYVELSAHVLPPVRPSWYAVAAPGVHPRLLTQVTGAPWRLARAGAHRLGAAAGRAQRGGWHDHSARLGVRELVAGPADGLPALEAAKYVKVVERVVVEAVADFLERYDLDATTFRAQVPTATA